MESGKVSAISGSEWEVMRVIWTLKNVTSHQLVEIMQQKRQWSVSTVKTLLSRLVAKKMLATRKDGRQFVYQPLVTEMFAMSQTSLALFQDMCAMKVGKALLADIKELTLSKNDIDDLMQMLQAKRKTAPSEIACNCLPREHCCEGEQ
ncbi:CopY/TcrY family copper transport repressor [Liquorilactobacillus satsumensis]|nr:CopY/TcrY family copper transport repressor [Liquorilactobacillus satsumensis]MCC7666818.1 CopY/TcrY family copper transport repressor [Liquorilactobacillus satsumensis]MCP9312017.1 CopY/TcrY family copper transport repressor [Liquorilactobacillus satsumensis]MCP9329649.1 CopY/TcrY family copper transport repressor [Liquorilactobacillus satsumensis]MCP9358368.1 CopY/TcrY family copper transport repressor [Liquorilactobacillus satsumensis]MCP9359151.1 CopY/TcrY family copper transport repres